MHILYYTLSSANKELANLQFKGGIPKTVPTSDINCKFEGFPKITLSFNNSLGLRELIESYYTHGCS